MEEVEGLFAASAPGGLVLDLRGGDREESVGSALGFSSSEDEVDVSVGVFSKVN